MFNLILKQQEDHAHSDHIFGQIPHFAFDVDVRQKRLEPWRDGEHRSPGKESGNCDERSGRGAAIGIPKMNAAAEIDREQYAVQRQAASIAGLELRIEKKTGQGAIQSYQKQAQGTVKRFNANAATNSGKAPTRIAAGIRAQSAIGLTVRRPM